VTLEGARDVPAESAEGYVLYPEAHGLGAHLLHRPSAEGTEDYILFESSPPVPEVAYRVALGDRVAGLRLIDEVVEFLDGAGVPRLRMAAPALLSGDGALVRPAVAVEECEFDADPRPPWDRPLTPLSTNACKITIHWRPDGIMAPIVLDPTWSTTGSMSQPRYKHFAHRLATGDVLVGGGPYNDSTSTELFHPATGTWSQTGPMQLARQDEASAMLADGRVMVAGGVALPGGYFRTAKVELYHPSLGQWLASGDLLTPRSGHTGTTLADGRVLVAGGHDNTTDLKSAELWDQVSGTWSPTGSLPKAISRALGALLLPNGDVLFVCGPGQMSFHYHSASGSWTYGPNQGASYPESASAVSLTNGGVLITGAGFAERYDWSTDAWIPAVTMQEVRSSHRAVVLGSGKVLAVGGQSTQQWLSSSELGDSVGSNWLSSGDMKTPRLYHSATLLANGAVLVAGGQAPLPLNTVASAELFGLIPGTGTCMVDGECVSGFCVDGVCCNSACDQVCVACAAAKTGVLDGVCAPVTASTDPNQSCLDTGSPSCTLNGKCDGQGACQKYPTQSSCTPEPCKGNADCLSAWCADGICCDTKCDGECQACTTAKKGSGVDGLCGPIGADADPDGECAEDPDPKSCKKDGSCGGTGQCRKYAKPDTACGTLTCVNGVLDGSMCDGKGVCVQTSKPCAPFACADTKHCGTSCNGQSDCASNAWCEAGKCKTRLPQGQACANAEECEPGFCVDGVCCNKPCLGQCEACDEANAAGTCVPVLGKPRGGRAACAAAPADNRCAEASCDGVVSDRCNGFVGPDQECRPAKCEAGVATLRGVCTGKGVCQDLDTKKCEPYACGADRCKDSCDGNADCAAGYECDLGRRQCVGVAAVCDGDHSLVPKEGPAKDCLPYRCSPANVCLNACTSRADCVQGMTCTVDGRCEPVSQAAMPESGCGCRAGGRSPGGAAAFALLSAVTFLARRRRRPDPNPRQPPRDPP
jgi:MYXO-CTERM domain-containing protein